MITRISHIEVAVARIGSNQASYYEELITDRKAMDKLANQIERIGCLEIDA